jgi:hypothetical protein
MKTPASVRIGPFDYRFVEMDETDGQAHYGSYSSERQEIRLRKQFASPAQWAETVLHEILHGIWDDRSINSKEGEEQVVRKSALGLASVIRHNQVLFAEIAKALK